MKKISGDTFILIPKNKNSIRLHLLPGFAILHLGRSATRPKANNSESSKRFVPVQPLGIRLFSGLTLNTQTLQ